MANPMDEYAQAQPENQAPAQSAGSDLAGQWRSWIDAPGNRAALLQFGISLMQPMGYGQNALGHVGQALGSAGEAVQRQRGQQLKEEEAASKMDLRAAQAERAEAGARVAGMGSEVAAERARIAQEQLQLRQAIDPVQRARELEKDRQEANLKRSVLGLPELSEEAYFKSIERTARAIRGSQGSQGVGGGGVSQQFQEGQIYPIRGRDGTVKRMRFLGGDPKDQSRWQEEKAGGA